MFSRLYVTAPLPLPPLQLLKTAALGTGTNLKPVRKMKPHKLHKLQKPYTRKTEKQIKMPKNPFIFTYFLILGEPKKMFD